MKILMVLTLARPGFRRYRHKTGSGLKNFPTPSFIFRNTGMNSPALASPKGGQPPVIPSRPLPELQTPSNGAVKAGCPGAEDLANTVKLSDMRSEGFDTIFFVGGHGPMWDIVDNPDSIALIK